MTDDQLEPYIWDRSGPPVADIQRLETVLAAYRFDQPLDAGRHHRRVSWLWYGAALSAAAVVLCAAYVALIPIVGQPGPDWRVIAEQGEPRVSGVAIASGGLLSAGGVLETDAHARAEIRVGRVGRIEVEPDTRIRLVSTTSGRHRLALDRGRIAAHLWSPPFTFGFITPAADAFDVGCAFTMDVDARGAAVVHVTSGWVSFEASNGQQLVPEGTVAVAEPSRGVGTAHFESASPTFKEALRRLDFETLSAVDRQRAFDTLLSQARSTDVYTLVQLGRRLTAEERGALYDRVEQLRPPPAVVTRTGIMNGDATAFDTWRHSLGFPEVKRWWLYWADAF